MKKTGPYVGITGFMCIGEAVTCNTCFSEAVAEEGELVPRDLKLMIGILVSSKTLLGLPNKHPMLYPVRDNVSQITSQRHPHLLHTIHYNTDDPGTIDEQVEEVFRLDLEGIDAIQLNIAWVSPVKLQRIRRRHPEKRIILQIGPEALKEVHEPSDIYLGEALQSYRGVIDDFLIDDSAGDGKELEVWRAFACISDTEIPREMGVGMAGGREESNVHEMTGLIRRLQRPINTDSQKRMRTPSDNLDLAKSCRFLRAHIQLLNKCSRWLWHRTEA